MAKSRQQKEQALQQLNDLLSKKGVVLFNYAGLKVSDIEALRTKLREANAQLFAAKRTLLKLVFKNKELSADDIANQNGPVAVVVADDEVTPAKIVADFKKRYDQIEFYGGILENQYIDKTKVQHLALLPSKPELLAKLVGSMKSPITGFVNVLSGNLRGLVTVLDAIKDKKAN